MFNKAYMVDMPIIIGGGVFVVVILAIVIYFIFFKNKEDEKKNDDDVEGDEEEVEAVVEEVNEEVEEEVEAVVEAVNEEVEDEVVIDPKPVGYTTHDNSREVVRTKVGRNKYGVVGRTNRQRAEDEAMAKWRARTNTGTTYGAEKKTVIEDEYTIDNKPAKKGVGFHTQNFFTYKTHDSTAIDNSGGVVRSAISGGTLKDAIEICNSLATCKSIVHTDNSYHFKGKGNLYQSGDHTSWTKSHPNYKHYERHDDKGMRIGSDSDINTVHVKNPVKGIDLSQAIQFCNDLSTCKAVINTPDGFFHFRGTGGVLSNRTNYTTWTKPK
jgi:hypothetical protein